MTMNKLKKKVFEIIQPSENESISSKGFEIFIIGLILISVVGVFITTFPISDTFLRVLGYFELIAIIIFTIEYLLRIWTADMLFSELSPVKARFRYLFSSMAIIDFIAILPFYLPMILPFNLLSIRVVRLARLLRLFKLNRYSLALASIGKIFKQKSNEICVSLFCVILLLIISSLLIFHVEHEAQPDKFKNAFSGLWWAVATLTTVGYGDIYPVTIAGKIFGACIAILGIGMVAIPTGILSAGFIEHLNSNKHDDENNYCPHCGKKLK